MSGGAVKGASGDARGTVRLVLTSAAEASRAAIALRSRWSVLVMDGNLVGTSLPAADVAVVDLPSLLQLSFPTVPYPLIVICSAEELDALGGVGFADDVLVQPWYEDELRFRVERLAPGRRRRIGGVELLWAPNTVSLSWSDKRSLVSFSHRLYTLFDLLARRLNAPVPRDVICRILDPTAGCEASRSVDMAISRLRQSLAILADASPITLELRACRGVGYSLHADNIPLVDKS